MSVDMKQAIELSINEPADFDFTNEDLSVENNLHSISHQCIVAHDNTSLTR